jgi:hypothetical protein
MDGSWPSGFCFAEALDGLGAYQLCIERKSSERMRAWSRIAHVSVIERTVLDSPFAGTALDRRRCLQTNWRRLMTNRDPYDARNRGPDGWGAATLGVFALGALLALGGVLYMMKAQPATTTTAPRPTAPTTTGQGAEPAPGTPAPRTPGQ